MNPMYRNQTNTMSVIQAVGTMRINTPHEAVAYLRAQQAVNNQIIAVLQRISLREQQRVNRMITPVKEEVKEEAPAPEPVKTFEPEDLSSDEGFSEEEIEKRVSQLKSARKESKGKK